MNDAYTEKVSIMEDIGYIAIESRVDPLATSIINNSKDIIRNNGIFKLVKNNSTYKKCEFRLTKLALERALEMVNKELSKLEKED